MATEPTVNGASSAASGNLSAAERLQAKHEAEAAHHAMVEDAIDEEDIAHPPPSMLVGAEPQSAADPVETAQLSEKAAGKQKAREEDGLSSPEPDIKRTNGVPPLNTHSEEAFPALGGGTKAAAPASTSLAWGAKKPSSVHAGANGGVNGHGPLSSMTSSRASTPASGMVTPASANPSIAPQPRGLSMPHMAMPNRHSERIQFAPSQLLPKNKMKKPLQEVLRGINKKSKAKVEMKPGPNGVIIFEGTGPVDAARQALKDLAKEVGSPVGRPSLFQFFPLMSYSNTSKSQSH